MPKKRSLDKYYELIKISIRLLYHVYLKICIQCTLIYIHIRLYIWLQNYVNYITQYIYHITVQHYNAEVGKMSIAVACRRSLVLGQSADLYVPCVWYSADCRGLQHWFRHRDGGHLAGFYVTVCIHNKHITASIYVYTTMLIYYISYASKKNRLIVIHITCFVPGSLI